MPKLGQIGEDLAFQFLLEHGYRIMRTNYRYKRSEIDLIAQQNGLLVFVEVKTRSSISFGHPEDFVNHHKMRMMATGATGYLDETGYEGQIQFDILSYHKYENAFVVKHLKDAFWPGLFD